MPARSIARAMAPPSASISFVEMALADAADGGVAAHLPERLDVLRQQQRAHAHARRGERGLGAGVAAADDDAIVTSGIVHR